jgi:hypothetical protein
MVDDCMNILKRRVDELAAAYGENPRGARPLNRTCVELYHVHCRKTPAKWLFHRSDLGESRILGHGIRRLKR